MMCEYCDQEIGAGHCCYERRAEQSASGTGFSGNTERIEPIAPPRRFELVTLRDQFAMAALIGLCADTNCNGSTESFAKSAYSVSDAMLAEREKQKEKDNA